MGTPARLKDAWKGTGVSPAKRILLGLASIAAAAVCWCLCLHLFYVPPRSQKEVAQEALKAGTVDMHTVDPAVLTDDAISPRAKMLAEYHLRLWTDRALREQEVAKMRRANAEWDFMGRTFLVLALGDMAQREPGERARYLEVMDQIIDETLKLEKEKGMYHFLMGYAKDAPYVVQPARSLFLDGEIALMLGVRQLVEERSDYGGLLTERIDFIVSRMKKGPVRCAESYPNECWMFCNTAALAAVRISDTLDGRDHSEFLKEWVQTAKKKLVDEKTGLLVSSFSVDGHVMDGPEGSSIWMACHCLRLVDTDFARDQYKRARKELCREFLGFGYAREWPTSWQGAMDVDSGPVVPGFEASASSSGLALMAASSFGDQKRYRQLLGSLELLGLPIEESGRLRSAASNQVGDAVILYGMVTGPTWKRVLAGDAR